MGDQLVVGVLGLDDPVRPEPLLCRVGDCRSQRSRIQIHRSLQALSGRERGTLLGVAVSQPSAPGGSRPTMRSRWTRDRPFASPNRAAIRETSALLRRSFAMYRAALDTRLAKLELLLVTGQRRIERQERVIADLEKLGR